MFRVDQKMSAGHSVSAQEAQIMCSNMKEISDTLRHAQTEKLQLLQVCVCVCVCVNFVICTIFGA